MSQQVLIQSRHFVAEDHADPLVFRNLILRKHYASGHLLDSPKQKALVFVEEHPDRSQACQREHQIKQYAKQEKESLIKESH